MSSTAVVGENSTKREAVDDYKETGHDSPVATNTEHDTTEDREGGEEAVYDARVEKIYK